MIQGCDVDVGAELTGEVPGHALKFAKNSAVSVRVPRTTSGITLF